MAAIDIQKLSFSYGKMPFIEGLSATFARKEVTSIVGPNGCGKSTLVKLIDGMRVPQAGQVLIDGSPTLSMPGRERACKMAVLAQASRPPAISVHALVACGRYPHRRHQGRLSPADKRSVDAALEMAGIEAFRDNDVRQLSGGERQRAFIAMTLAQETDIIVLDEPTTYLDIKACHETMQLVRKLNEEAGKTIVMVIHDLDLALRYSDKVMVMERGACLDMGSVDEVLASGALERAFHMDIHATASAWGTSYCLFPAQRENASESISRVLS